jgi:hypothetical protein
VAPSRSSNTSRDDKAPFTNIHAKVHEFRAHLRSLEDTDRLRACVLMRDELLEQRAEHEWLFASIEEVMLEECPQYEKTKGRCSRGKDEEAKQWARFIGVARSGAELKKQCLAPLTKASCFWGANKVQHYQWAFVGWGYCKKLGTAASRNPTWDEAVVKLNQLLLSRVASGTPLKVSVNPITQSDLEQLGSWQTRCDYEKTGKDRCTLRFQPISLVDLPEGYTLDQHGLVVSTKVAHPPRHAVDTLSSTQNGAPSPQTGGPLASPLVGSAFPAASSPLLPSRTTSPVGNSTLSSVLEVRGSTARIPPPENIPTIRRSGRIQPTASYPESSPWTSSASSLHPKRKNKVQPSIASTSHTCTCTASPEFLSGIERNHQSIDVHIARVYSMQRPRLCKKHLEQYATWATKGIMQNQWPSHSQTIGQQERSELQPSKRRRLSLPEALSRDRAAAPLNTTHGRPVHDTAGDDAFREQVLDELRCKVVEGLPKTWGQWNDNRMYALLSQARRPVTSGCGDEMEAYYFTGAEAEDRLDSCVVLHGPIITENQQQFKWKDNRLPTEQLFRRLGNLDREVAVQKSSRSLREASCVKMQLSSVQYEFQKNGVSQDSLNVLRMGSPLPRSILPSFLTGEDCQLLGRIRDAVLDGNSNERCAASIGEWQQWKDVEDWVLLAQGGAQTLLHQYSCGKATWLTVQQGPIGFGWISRPTQEEIRDWSADPSTYTGDRLRYVVLCPGQTIYFEAGTIHFVFRTNQHPTFMLGGHIMRWSRVVSTMEVLLNQLNFPDTTNEELFPSAKVYVETMVKLLSHQVRQGRIGELGGEEVVARFAHLKEVKLPTISRSDSMLICVQEVELKL